MRPRRQSAESPSDRYLPTERQKVLSTRVSVQPELPPHRPSRLFEPYSPGCGGRNGPTLLSHREGQKGGRLLSKLQSSFPTQPARVSTTRSDILRAIHRRDGKEFPLLLLHPHPSLRGQGAKGVERIPTQDNAKVGSPWRGSCSFYGALPGCTGRRIYDRSVDRCTREVRGVLRSTLRPRAPTRARLPDGLVLGCRAVYARSEQ